MDKSSNRHSIVFYLNGQRTEVSGDDVFKPFAYYLRYHLDKPGTKTVCSEGDCGACTIMMAPFRAGQLQKFQAINSCIAPLFSLDLCHVVSVEGIAELDQLSPIQKSFVENGGAQCGYCTPGFICALSALTEDCLIENKPITEKKARNYLTGNLCRCTGYEPILKAATLIDLKEVKSLSRYVTKESLSDFANQKDSVHIKTDTIELFLPTNFKEALQFKTADVRLMAGATDLGVLINKDKLALTKVLSLMHIEQMQKINVNDDVCTVGARVTLSQFEEALKSQCTELAEILKVFASPQIKNSATLIGNVVNASPIADTIPALMVLNTVIITESIHGVRRIPIEQFYIGYKKLDLQPDEIVSAVQFEIPKADQILKLFKVAPRKDLDISVVTFAGFFKIEDHKITTVRLAFGGVGPTVLRLRKLESAFLGQSFKADLFSKLSAEVENEIAPLSDLRGSREFRLKLGSNLLKKCYQEISAEHGL